MLITHSHICGGVSKLHAFKDAIRENFKPELVDYILGGTTTSAGDDMRYNLKDGTVCYVYAIGKGYYRIDFTCEARQHE